MRRSATIASGRLSQILYPQHFESNCWLSYQDVPRKTSEFHGSIFMSRMIATACSWLRSCLMMQVSADIWKSLDLRQQSLVEKCFHGILDWGIFASTSLGRFSLGIFSIYGIEAMLWGVFVGVFSFKSSSNSRSVVKPFASIFGYQMSKLLWKKRDRTDGEKLWPKPKKCDFFCSISAGAAPSQNDFTNRLSHILSIHLSMAIWSTWSISIQRETGACKQKHASEPFPYSLLFYIL